MTSADGTFRRDSAGEPAFVLPVYDRDNELCDLIAWFPADGSPWWYLYGDETPILGAREAAIAAWYNKPIHLFATPQDWAIGQGRGICVLRWGVPLDDILDGIPRIACHYTILARRLRKSLRSWEPKVVTTRNTHHAV